MTHRHHAGSRPRGRLTSRQARIAGRAGRRESYAVDEPTLSEVAERDQLWASLRALGPEIERLAADQWDGSDRERQLVRVLSGVVAAELRYRAKAGDGEP